MLVFSLGGVFVFDGGEIFLTRTFDPDLSGNAIPGTWTKTNFDVFGIVDRSVNFRFADDTLLSPTFTGIFPSTETDMFFGAMDTVNDDNPAGTGVLTYTFDISGQSDLMFSAEFVVVNVEVMKSLLVTDCVMFVELMPVIRPTAGKTCA